MAYSTSSTYSYRGAIHRDITIPIIIFVTNPFASLQYYPRSHFNSRHQVIPFRQITVCMLWHLQTVSTFVSVATCTSSLHNSNRKRAKRGTYLSIFVVSRIEQLTSTFASDTYATCTALHFHSHIASSCYHITSDGERQSVTLASRSKLLTSS